MFRMHAGVRTTEMKLEISMQMAVEQVLIQKSKENAKWTAEGAKINEYVSANAAEPGNFSVIMP